MSKKKDEQLGQSYGSANNKLKKNILFKYITLAGENFCFRCGAEITSVDDFTVDHKEPWLYNDITLFWSLDNIAFSHAKCNIAAARSRINNSDTCIRGHKGKRLRNENGDTHCYECKNESRRRRGKW